MALRLLLSNDTATVGYAYDTRYTHFSPLTNEASVHGISNSAGPYEVAVFPVGGTIVDFQIGVVAPAVSASGFVSGTVDVTPRLNSGAFMSAVPAIAMAGSAGQGVWVYTGVSTAVQQSCATSGIVNAASNAFNAGDRLSYDFNARSVGSAAATTAGKGLYAVLTARYSAT